MSSCGERPVDTLRRWNVFVMVKQPNRSLKHSTIEIEAQQERETYVIEGMNRKKDREELSPSSMHFQMGIFA